MKKGQSTRIAISLYLLMFTDTLALESTVANRLLYVQKTLNELDNINIL